MSAVVLASGTVRTTKVLTKNSDGSRFGRAVSILTDAAGQLGETLEVTVFDAREGESEVVANSGDYVTWVVEIEAVGSRLRARYRGEGGSEPALPATSDAWLAGASAESAPVA